MFCELEDLELPFGAVKWSCDKPLVTNKVQKNTKCFLECSEGFEITSGEQKYEFYVLAVDILVKDVDEKCMLAKNMFVEKLLHQHTPFYIPFFAKI